jgi:hypothetical protein
VATFTERLHVMRAKIVLHVSTVLSTWVSVEFAKQNNFYYSILRLSFS